MKKWRNPKRKRGEDGRDMLNGVGGLDVWWSLVAHPDESRKAPWTKREGGTELLMAGKRESFVLISQLKKLGRHIQMSDNK